MLKLLEQDSEVCVIEMKPLRQKEVTGTIEYFTGRHGTIDGDIGFTLGAYKNSGRVPCEGDSVLVKCVECKHNKMGWRALKVTPTDYQSAQT